MNTLADIIEYMKEKKVNPLTVDAWNLRDEAPKIYRLLKEIYKDTKEVVINDYKIKIDFTPGNGFGMGEEAPEFKVTVLLNF